MAGFPGHPTTFMQMNACFVSLISIGSISGGDTEHNSQGEALELIPYQPRELKECDQHQVAQ